MKNLIRKIGVGLSAVGASAVSAFAYDANYTASDIPSIATDAIGEGGVQLKTYMPLLILGFVVGIAGTAWMRAKRAFR